MSETQSRGGRPRSEQARVAVLHAVDDMLVEIGYAAMTMKGIAERAGVGRQTVYRWWSTKAEILFEACVSDAADELAPAPRPKTIDDVTTYLDSLINFLTTSPAGAAYRALIGEAQHDPAVADLLTSTDILGNSARPVLERAIERGDLPVGAIDTASTALLVGPVFYTLVTGGNGRISAHDMALTAIRSIKLLARRHPH